MATPLVSCQDLAKAYHARPLFDGLSFGVVERDRLAIIGPNGAGKSTLLRLLAGLEEPDAGVIAAKRNLRAAYVPQMSVFEPGVTARQVVDRSARDGGVGEADRDVSVARVLGQLGFLDADVPVDKLSGGWRKRLSIAAGVARAPDLLLLDEPTNHLDVEGIHWLEGFLRDAPFAWVMVSHDRWFLEKTATRIAELSRVYPGGVLLAEGRYSQFLEKRAEYVANQQSVADSLANKVRREVEWLRRGPQARTTKAKYRIDEAHGMIAELADVRGRLGTQGGQAKIDFSASGRKTKRLVVADGVAKTLGDKVIVKAFDFVLTPGMTVGLMGGNGTGKTTILKLLMRDLEPDGGTVTHAEGLRVVYFDQNRARLDPSLTLKQTLCEAGQDSVIFRGKLTHVMTWARRFQFQPAQLDVPVGELSGGEQARALIAKLMLEDADLLLLDEPTNDLDIPTLEALEESLSDFPGALVLVSHDRYLVDNVCNVIVGLDGEGGARLYADLSQWEEDLKAKEAAATKKARDAAKAATPAAATAKPRDGAKRLSYMEQREYDRIEGEILAAEEQVESWRAKVEDPGISSNAAKLGEAAAKLSEAEQAVEKLYARWQELAAKIQ